MHPKERDRLSRIRQALSELVQEVEELIAVFAARDPMVKGTVYEQRRKCGKPTCGCASGPLHGTMILSRSKEGRTKLISIASEQVEELRVLTGQYQRFRRARARLGQIHRKMLSLIDRLEAARRREP